MKIKCHQCVRELLPIPSDNDVFVGDYNLECKEGHCFVLLDEKDNVLKYKIFLDLNTNIRYKIISNEYGTEIFFKSIEGKDYMRNTFRLYKRLDFMVPLPLNEKKIYVNENFVDRINKLIVFS